jgi:hypothetical protein
MGVLKYPMPAQYISPALKSPGALSGVAVTKNDAAASEPLVNVTEPQVAVDQDQDEGEGF